MLIDNFARLAAVVGVMLAVPLFAFAGYLWMTSMGDPNRAAAARNAVISVGVGVVIIGCAFIIPAVIGESVVAPVGGIVYEQDSGAQLRWDPPGSLGGQSAGIRCGPDQFHHPVDTGPLRRLHRPLLDPARARVHDRDVQGAVSMAMALRRIPSRGLQFPRGLKRGWICS